MLLDFLDHSERDPKTGFLNLMQKDLIKQVLENIGLDVGAANGKFTSPKGKPLAKNVQGEPASGDFNYSSVVGLQMYHTLILLMLSTVLQDICSAQALCTSML